MKLNINYLIIIFLMVLILLVNGQYLDVPSLIKDLKSGVVLVQTESSIGSGVIISMDGYILTNFHVIQESQKINTEITIKTHTKDIYKAKVIDYDEDLDICLLKSTNLVDVVCIKIANPDSVKVGEDVVCIGNPFGVSEYVTKGIISKYNTPYIFSTASINPGNSGGALLNMKGELVGIPTMMLEKAQNFNLSLCPRTIIYFLNKNNINYNSVGISK